jgi:hypothetical protein
MIFKDNVANCQNAKKQYPEEKQTNKEVKSRRREQGPRVKIRKKKIMIFEYTFTAKKLLFSPVDSNL